METTMPEKKKSGGVRKWIYAVMVGGLACAVGAGVFWHVSGRVELDGLFLNTSLPVLAERGGLARAVKVAPGDTVAEGDVLVQFDEGDLRQKLEAQRKRLAELEMLLPPSLMQAPGNGGSGESLTGKHERLRSEEQQADRRVQEAAAREAQAAVYYNRVALQVARGRMTAEDRDAADIALQMARAETERARSAFESTSGSRAAAGTDIQRFKDIHAASGADMVPESMRIKQYEEQRQRIFATLRELESARVTAPESGVVVDVSVAAGEQVAAMQPCVVLRPTARPPLVRALAGAGSLGKLRLGQQASVTLHGPQEMELAGYVASFAPPARPGDVVYAPGESANIVVWIAVDEPADQQGRDMLYALPQSTPAEVVVALRDPVRSLAASPESIATQESDGVYGGNVAGESVPVVKAGSAEAGGRLPGQEDASGQEGTNGQAPSANMPMQAEPPALPKLPRMQPNGPVSGPAPAAQPGNNPSIASPEILKGADSEKPLLP